MDDATATVLAVHRSATHAFSKQRVDVITLHEGLVVDADGTVTRRAGVLGIVSRSGTVCPGDAITVALPPPPYFPLTRV